MYVLSLDIIPQSQVWKEHDFCSTIVATNVARINLGPVLTFSPDFSEDEHSLDIFSFCYLRFRIFSTSILVTLHRSLKENTTNLNEGKKKGEISGGGKKTNNKIGNILKMWFHYILSDFFLSVLPCVMSCYPQFPGEEIQTWRD